MVFCINKCLYKAKFAGYKVVLVFNAQLKTCAKLLIYMQWLAQYAHYADT